MRDDSTADPVLVVEDLEVSFVSLESVTAAVNGVTFTVAKGEVLCILGETGCGKSVTLRSLIRLLPRRRTRLKGRIQFNGADVLAMRPAELAELRGGDIAMIFQEPGLAFDPVYKVGQQMIEAIRRHNKITIEAARVRARELLEMVQVPSAARCLASYPHELSGGMCQRAMIAVALSCRPGLLLADEPTTALDATVQIQVLLLLRRLQRDLGMAMILVTHDIGVASEIADRIAVMYAGRIVECGPVRNVIRRPRHPYTEGLLASTVHGNMRGQRLPAIIGAPPDPTDLPPGCSFAPRCPKAIPACNAGVPGFYRAEEGHQARCILLAPPSPAPCIQI